MGADTGGFGARDTVRAGGDADTVYGGAATVQALAERASIDCGPGRDTMFYGRAPRTTGCEKVVSQYR